ncbi:hypothetical protein B7494_g3106 [Chlorociboria aeruginascens]|nr:hypothetical protein B7494_g3106 [Chlorociboria aeruginascens]
MRNDMLRYNTNEELPPGGMGDTFDEFLPYKGFKIPKLLRSSNDTGYSDVNDFQANIETDEYGKAIIQERKEYALR